MKINRQILVATLEKLVPMLGNNPLQPEFQYFQIEGTHFQVTDGVLLVDTSGLIDTGLCCSVPKEVFGLLDSLKVEEVNLEVIEGELQVKTNKIEGKFSVLTPPKFQQLPYSISEDVSCIESSIIRDVIEGLGFCQFGVSRDIAAGPYCGVQINGRNIFSTDRYRIVKWDLEKDTGIKCAVPVKFIDLLKKYRDNIVSLGVVGSTNFVGVLDDKTCISTCLIQGEYPELLQYFSRSKKYEQIEFGGKLAPVVERHSALLKDIDQFDRTMLIKIGGGTCTLTSNVPEKSNLVEQVDVELREDLKLSFSVNPTFLKEIAGRCSGFKYFDGGLILFEADKLQYLMRSGEVG